MKLIDRKKGKIFGINVIDFFVIAVFLFLVFITISTVFQNKMVYNGEEVYQAVKAVNKLEMKGFLVEATVTGRNIGDPFGKEIVKQGMVVDAYGGTIVLKNKYGDKTTVGGSMSYLEDFSANRVELIPLYDSSVSFYPSKRQFSNFSNFIDTLKDIKKESGAVNVVLSGNVLIQNPGVGFPVFENNAARCFACVRSKAQKLGVNFYSLNYYLIDLNEVERLNLSSGEVTLKNFKVYLGFSGKLKEEKLDKLYSYLKADGILRDRREATYVSVEKLL
ncbi:MAG TPA: hypothetical protein ENI78_00385 [Euryarchaeota archaeon]|nr:hypothetical protein [Euryarchaeota archaeon]